MISLYFNTKLTGVQLNADVKYNGFSFYPLMYARHTSGLSQVDILLGVIDSYKEIFFQNAVFNIDIDDLPNCDSVKNKLLKEIKCKINVQNKLVINFNRPSTAETWIENVKKYSDLIGGTSPALVVMNHDHPFVDYSSNVLELVVDNVFRNSDENFKKVLSYSHAPETVSNIINDERYVIDASLNVDYIYKYAKINDWLDSLYIMSMDTLLYLFNNMVVQDDQYIGRFDWIGVYYKKNLDLTSYACSRELFRHYDGYSHVTGMRLDTELTDIPFSYAFPSDEDINEVVFFYYQRWIDCYFLSIRDYMRKQFFLENRKHFNDVIGKTLVEFEKVYIDNDIKNNIIKRSDKAVIVSGLLNNIYYNANHIFLEIETDNKLSNKSFVKRVFGMIPYKYKAIVKNYLNKYR